MIDVKPSSGARCSVFRQAFVQAAPTILVGLVVAGIFRRLLGHEGTRRLFGCGTRRELPQAWLIGMLLPVCSLGVIPIAREMRRARISGGAILAFAMTAPLFNPLSMLYGLTLSEPFVILSFAFCTMLVVTAVGAIWNRIFPGTAYEEPAPPPVAYGVKRMAAIVVAAAREVVGPSLGYIVIALLGVVLLSRRAAARQPSDRRWSTRTRTPRWRWRPWRSPPTPRRWWRCRSSARCSSTPTRSGPRSSC